ncbi:MAG: nitrogen regulation protein NR(I) [Burkholderiaceae bacterium]|jgi:two-component system nitrogen regulation response regulator GlnG
MQTVWIVDDDQSIRWVLEKAVTRAGLSCRAFDSANLAIDALGEIGGERPRVVISDIRMPGRSGLQLLECLQTDHPQTPVIIMTAYSDLASAVSSFRGGAFEYLPKPFDINKAVELIQRAVGETRDHTKTPATIAGTVPVAAEIFGQAPPMQDLFRAIGRLSQSSVTVLLTGESGSGKELVARALHKHSPRAANAFVAINTAAIPPDLLESELFGHERGAFTGAAMQRQGRFEQAENGTLFLDEIGDMPPELQTRLLRVLSDGHYYRVGGCHPIKANVRIIAATHQNLEGRVKNGLFREDLYHRLNVIRLRLPALRERQDDIPLLARHFLVSCAKELGVEPKRLTETALHALTLLNYPGNVRQLENICRWLTVMAPAQTVQVHDLPPDLLTEVQDALLQTLESESAARDELAISDEEKAMHSSGHLTSVPTWLVALENAVRSDLQAGVPRVMDKMLRDFEAVLIQTALLLTKGRRIEAAEKLGMGRNTITRKIQELGL